ncbi:proline-rich protein HaeIII subfamily 1-like [Dipodomys merriami]|uniref:proline-rich protein HaeIII subfamily 1-like n=1 Tax=Dipodomys merriami TaxID=94247 RepID=UPI0038560BB3
MSLVANQGFRPACVTSPPPLAVTSEAIPARPRGVEQSRVSAPPLESPIWQLPPWSPGCVFLAGGTRLLALTPPHPTQPHTDLLSDPPSGTPHPLPQPALTPKVPVSVPSASPAPAGPEGRPHPTLGWKLPTCPPPPTPPQRRCPRPRRRRKAPARPVPRRPWPRTRVGTAHRGMRASSATGGRGDPRRSRPPPPPGHNDPDT